MGYPEHLLLAFGGKLGVVEDWSCSLRLTSQGFRALPVIDQQQYAVGSIDLYLEVIKAYIGGPNSYFNGMANLNWVKCNPIDANGHYSGNDTVERHQDAAYVAGTGGAGPFQASLAITLETGVQRGLAVAGRYFIPCGPLVPNDSGQFSEQRANQIRDTAHDFLRAINAVSGSEQDFQPNPKVHVISRGKKSGNTWGTGIARPVTGIAVGRAVDTQQRRRKKIREEWVHVDL